jgi:post-segregation antitoxin (ccd killing protein)
MTKIHTTISLDDNLIQISKDKNINLSGTLNTILKRYFEAQNKNQEITAEIKEAKELSKLECLRLTTHLQPEIFEEILDLAKQFWASDIGKETVRKSRDKNREKTIKLIERAQIWKEGGPSHAMHESNEELFNKVVNEPAAKQELQEQYDKKLIEEIFNENTTK